MTAQTLLEKIDKTIDFVNDMSLTKCVVKPVECKDELNSSDITSVNRKRIWKPEPKEKKEQIKDAKYLLYQPQIWPIFLLPSSMNIFYFTYSL